jgi:dCMP deaminase
MTNYQGYKRIIRGEKFPPSHWDHKFMALADHIAQWSKIKTTKVGVVIVNWDNHIISVGFNGFPMRIKDTDERLNDREMARDLAMHAESNAIANRGSNTVYGCILYCTHFPCIECAKIIIQAGIQTVVVKSKPTCSNFIEKWKPEMSLNLFREAGINVHYMEDENA